MTRKTKEDIKKMQKFKEELVDSKIEVDCTKMTQVSKIIEWANLWMLTSLNVNIRYSFIDNKSHWYVIIYDPNEERNYNDITIVSYKDVKK